MTSPSSCRWCGCTEARACPGGCSWARPGVCSTCAKSIAICRCGKEIIWAVSEQGESIPCDPAISVYVVSPFEGKIRCYRAPLPDGRHMVNHFSTCRLANQFLKKEAVHGTSQTAD